MKEPYRKDLASHSGPESCASGGNSAGEALTGEEAGRDIELRNHNFGVPTQCVYGEGHTSGSEEGEPPEDPTESKTLCTSGHSSHGNRESQGMPSGLRPLGRPGKATNLKPGMHVPWQSDGPIVPEKRPNKGAPYPAPAEVVEGRGPTKGNAKQTFMAQTQRWTAMSPGLLRVREAARKDKEAKFTALLHHVTVDLLRESFHALKHNAAPGVDGITWAEYKEGLESRLVELHHRVHQGTYRARPSKRTYIPKADGKLRPLGIAALEDKIVQQAVVEVLNQVYETDFLGFSYGFRPKRGPHQALDALCVAITEKPVNWVLDCDIRAFFDTLSHEWTLQFLKHRIADTRILRLIAKWLKAGVSEEGQWSTTEVGTPQGAVVSPLLANVYLHYVLDLWVNQWRRKNAKGIVIIVRYADDFVMGFQYREEAERFLADLRIRLDKFGLSLHPDKTRLIEFGRFAADNREKRGEGKPETFDFLGFTHQCAKTRENRRFTVRRQTVAKRLRSKLKAIREKLYRHRHKPVAKLGAWLGGVVRGYLNYHAIPSNGKGIRTFREEVVKSWLHALRRRSQKSRLTWTAFSRLADRWIPRAHILHPYPDQRFHAIHPR